MAAKKSFYKMPPADWEKRYNEAFKTEGSIAPTADYWWAVESVREYHRIDYWGPLGQHMDEIEAFHRWIVFRRAEVEGDRLLKEALA
jgi:hypothetical protein